MKELYISPELNLLCLAPQEKLMNSNIDFDSLLTPPAESGDGVVSNPEIDIEIPLI